MFSRRDFLTTATASSLIAATGCFNAPQSIAQNKITKIGLQTYTLRDVFETDPMGTLKMIKAAGYDYVELNSRNFAERSAAVLRGMLDEAGLPAPVTHISLDMIKGDLSGLIQTAQILDIEYLVVPYIGEDMRTLEHWKAHAKIMNAAGEALRDKGFKLAYHNHQFEFEDLGGGTVAMDILLNECKEDNLIFELDMFWAVLGNADIPALFKANPGRFKLCHIKDMGPNKADFIDGNYEDISSKLMKNVGDGILPFETFFALNDVSGMTYFIAEHDAIPKPYAASLSQSYNAIKAMRF